MKVVAVRAAAEGEGEPMKVVAVRAAAEGEASP
jgi:hypothetical protein